MLELLFIRHGRTEYNVNRKVMGRKPIPLDDVGRAQSKELAVRLSGEKIDAIISSPVFRAIQTAEVIAAFHEDLKVEQDEGLIEIDYGQWEDLTFDDLVAKHESEWRTYREDPKRTSFPGGESMKEAGRRVGEFMDKILKRFDTGRVALISHADVIKLAFLHVLDMELKYLVRFSIDNCAICLVRITKDTGPRLVILSSLDGIGKDMISIDSTCHRERP
ncbi:MAG: histidine phosphatase family protein [Pseudomonadota bacterium]